MTSIELSSDLRNYCQAHANEDIVKKYSRYFKQGVYDAWGLSQALMYAKKEELKKSGKITVDFVFETAPLLMKSGKYEETSFALIMISLVKEKLIKNDFKRLESWFEVGITNWAHADYFGMFFYLKL
ncbi:MAG: DNA alkylation repair protein [Lentimicrobium sp.]|nr:DNA alkylation repair protein [Lentimicrobium sp.]